MRKKFLFFLFLIFSCSKFIEPEKDADVKIYEEFDTIAKEEVTDFLQDIDIFEEIEIFVEVEEDVIFPDEISLEDEYIAKDEIFEEIEEEFFEEFEEEKIEEGGFGWPCNSDLECKSNLCIESLFGKICTVSCEGDCPIGFQCKAGMKTKDGFLFYCFHIEDGLCLKCNTEIDCPKDAFCSKMPSGSYCVRKCSVEESCPLGFDCVEVGEGELDQFQCMPQVGDCACTKELDKANFICEISNEYGTCTGIIPCNAEKGWGKCSAFIPEKETCDGVDNNCNGIIDEGFLIKDWDGKEKKIGEECGTGVCAWGKVVCATTSSAVCSTAYLALEVDLCGNKKDDDCDGKVDAGCFPEDIDGDGYLNDNDCNPFKPEFHPNASEKCCPTEFVDEAVIKNCDFNCDGSVTYCSENDKDFDGFLPPNDCNDNDEKIYLGAPEKCGNNIDENCNGSDIPCNLVIDKDEDSYSPPFDCNDLNAEIHPWAEEKCNYIDDDCDGVIDDGNPEGGEKCGTDVGECEGGIEVCTHYPFGTSIECIGKKDPAQEICDYLDNDCNGLTDENFPDLNQPCDGDDIDFCKNGSFTCTPDGSSVECVNEKVTDIFEICDGIDNNCNGETDEEANCEPDDIDGDKYIEPDDCNNFLSEFNPKAKEGCCPLNLKDESAIKKCDKNCDGKINFCLKDDKDFDGFSPPQDCNDNDAKIYLEAPEKCGNDIDENCDGSDIPCALVIDKDKDGYSPPFDCNDNSADIHPWAKENCNYIDDDCDGVIDDGNPEGGKACGSDIGECISGLMVCVHYVYYTKVKCIVGKAPESEKCDGLDNDCDGKTDEDFQELGKPCDGDDEDKCKNGTYTCKPDGKGVECVNEEISFIELCDGLDNDCDGKSDEDIKYKNIPLGEECDGEGECGNGIVECSIAKTKATCSTNPDGSNPQASPEVCDSLDNNCNGKTDEGLTYFGKPVGAICKGIGICGIGTVVCSKITKLPTCSTNPDGTEPQNQPEICDGKDNNCDGHIDDNPSIATSNCKLKGLCNSENVKGKCKWKKWLCDYSQVAGYEGDSEISCDGLDNDCNGEIDEDFPLGTPCDGADIDMCKNGTWTCKKDKSGVECINEKITDIKELCNGFDDDCDNEIDEDFPVDDPCDGPDEDLCKTGTYVCKEDGKGVNCINDIGAQTEEVCDGLDNDCNGETDEKWPVVGNPCDSEDPDLCKNGIWTCKPDKTDVECVETLHFNEKCDGKDNDCDGEVDEEDAEGCLVFYSDEDEDGYGVSDNKKCLCAPKKPLTALLKGDCEDKNPQINPGKKDICNYIDDNCDTIIDNDFPNAKKLCDGPDPDLCANGIWECSKDGSKLECIGDENKPEVCDGKDNDCNGKIDEIFPVHKPCDGDDTDNCKYGTYTCKPDGSDVECINEIIVNIKEVCDGMDNDCDGKTDEDFPVGETCDGDDIDSCKTGTYTCKVDKTGVECVNEKIKDILEICDGVDNDCDGGIDEDWPKKGQKCDALEDADVCETGRYKCKDDKKGIVCVNDIPCAKGATCWSSGSDTLPDDCRCDGALCSIDNGNECINGVCKCYGKDACKLPKKCSPTAKQCI